MLQAFFIRNIDENPEKWVGFKPEHKLELVETSLDFVGSTSNRDSDTTARILKLVCARMWVMFNRGSGQEVSFDGPSMSVGDVVVINSVGDPRMHAFKCEMIGFKALTADEIQRSSFLMTFNPKFKENKS